MANKTRHAQKNVKKQKGEHKKMHVQTEYQRERDAAKRKRKHGREALVV